MFEQYVSIENKQQENTAMNKELNRGLGASKVDKRLQ